MLTILCVIRASKIIIVWLVATLWLFSWYTWFACRYQQFVNFIDEFIELMIISALKFECLLPFAYAKSIFWETCTIIHMSELLTLKFHMFERSFYIFNWFWINRVTRSKIDCQIFDQIAEKFHVYVCSLCFSFGITFILDCFWFWFVLYKILLLARYKATTPFILTISLALLGILAMPTKFVFFKFLGQVLQSSFIIVSSSLTKNIMLKGVSFF